MADPADVKPVVEVGEDGAPSALCLRCGEQVPLDRTGRFALFTQHGDCPGGDELPWAQRNRLQQEEERRGKAPGSKRAPRRSTPPGGATRTLSSIVTLALLLLIASECNSNTGARTGGDKCYDTIEGVTCYDFPTDTFYDANNAPDSVKPSKD